MADCPDTKRLHQWNPREVAEELCLMDAEVLRLIWPTELENGAWMKKSTKQSTSPNVMKMVGLFNQLALLIPTEILSETTPQARGRVITSYIQIASKCYSTHNYNSLKAVLAGLQCTPIFRLNKSWKEVPSRRRKRYQMLSTLMSEESNWQLYRKELEPRMASNSPFIPFLGVFLTDVALSQEAQSLAKKKGQGTERTLYETYTILEPITIRNKLEKLRSNSLEDAKGTSTSNAQSDSDHEDNTDSPFSIASPSPLFAGSPDISYTWDSDWDVTEWLKEIGLQEYAPSFIDNGYETPDLCGNMSGKDMSELGVTNKFHRGQLVKHARSLLSTLKCSVNEEDVLPIEPLKELTKPKLGAMKNKSTFSGTLSSSVECLISAVQSGGLIRSNTYERPDVMVKSTSLSSLNEVELTGSPDLSHKRTQSDTPKEPAQCSTTEQSHRRTQSENITSFSGLPPQLPLYSQGAHVFSPTKDIARAKSDISPLKSKVKNWIHDHQHKGSFLVLSKRKSKPLMNTSSSPVLIQRPRRASAAVPKLRASQMAAKSSDNKNPAELLSAYQLCSLSCSLGLSNNPELRDYINTAPHNTEALNYKLSYQLESD